MHPPADGRLGDADRPRDLRVGEAPVPPEGLDDVAVDLVETRGSFHHHRGIVGLLVKVTPDHDEIRRPGGAICEDSTEVNRNLYLVFAGIFALFATQTMALIAIPLA